MSEGVEQHTGRVLSAVAHDLRTPLATIFGFAKTIERQSALDGRQARYLTLIQDAALDMERMISVVSLVGHTLEGRFAATAEPVSTETLVIEAHRKLPVRVDARRVVIGDGDPGVVVCDAGRAVEAIALLADAPLRLNPSLATATLTARPDAVTIGPLSDELLAIITKPGRDLRVEAARLVLDRLGATLQAGPSELIVPLSAT
jgi:signal transduction histidine kinase